MTVKWQNDVFIITKGFVLKKMQQYAQTIYELLKERSHLEYVLNFEELAYITLAISTSFTHILTHMNRISKYGGCK